MFKVLLELSIALVFYLMDHGGKIMDSVMRNSNRFFLH